MDRAAVILAAGKGTRMKSDLTKVLHAVGGRSMLDWSLALADELGCLKRILVIGTHSDDLNKIAFSRVGQEGIAIQSSPEGTGHAVSCARSALQGFCGNIVILYADTPLLPVSAVEAAFDALEQGSDIAVLGFDANEPGGYGRIICSETGDLDRIVEAKDASPDELSVTFCNSGVMAVKSQHLFSLLEQVTNDNAKGEYYLTDIVGLGKKSGLRSVAVKCSEEDVLGVNSRVQLAEAEAVFQSKKRIEFMENGVTMIDPASVFVSHDTVIGQDVTLEPNVFMGPGVTLKDRVTIRANSHLEGCVVNTGSQIGPFARLRPGTHLGKDVKVGNFVEIKNTTLGDKVSASHLSYLGDGMIGAGSNIGAGTIFCNYDGYFKHQTSIGENAFIGSNSALVAPVSVGKNALIGSGSVITGPVPDGALSVARARQTNIEGWAEKYHERMSARKKGESDVSG